MNQPRSTSAQDLAEHPDFDLESLRFQNLGTVRRSMRFEYRVRPCYYTEDIDTWSTPWDRGHYSYLYDATGERPAAPPSGIRSAVPLGGLGAGTVELRADGSFRDWTIFNNSPADGGCKVQLEEALFAVRTEQGGEDAEARTLRTHPPRFLPGVERIDYSGAHPVSKLSFVDDTLPLDITLYATSAFSPRRPDSSAAPSAVFTFVLANKTADAVDAALLFLLPNHMGGSCDASPPLVIRRVGGGPVHGSMAVETRGFDDESVMSHDSLFRIWEEFAAFGVYGSSSPRLRKGIDPALGKPAADPSPLRYGSTCARLSIPAGGRRTATFVLAWHFPERTFSGMPIGNRYARLYEDAPAAARACADGLQDVWAAARSWNALCLENTLPRTLQDAMVNSASTIAKTGLWTLDGRWRQWESFSCPAVDPIHIHFYRVLPYAWFFPSLRRSQLLGFAAAQREDGYIQENLGGAGSPIDQGGGRMMGDGPTVFILEAYQDYLWSADRRFADELWRSVRKAVEWQCRRAERFGLPEKLNNSYDWWAFESKDLVAYNAFLHIAALLAARALAGLLGDAEVTALCSRELPRARAALVERLWTGSYFRGWWSATGSYPDALHADTLYGELWARVLGLEHTVDPSMLRRHLAAERELNGSPLGLKVMRRTGCDDDGYVRGKSGFNPGRGGPVNDIVWEAGSLDWCALNLYLNGDVSESLAEADKIFLKWQNALNDQWDIRDLTGAWDGHPWCNSHYARQLILWTIPLAISGQRYSAVERVLSFSPLVAPPYRLPFFTPTADGVLLASPEGDVAVVVENGALALDTIALHGEEAIVRRVVSADESVHLGRCP